VWCGDGGGVCGDGGGGTTWAGILALQFVFCFVFWFGPGCGARGQGRVRLGGEPVLCARREGAPLTQDC